MTGRLRLFTGSEQQADHERRIRELERALRPKQTDRTKSASGGGITTLGSFLRDTGDIPNNTWSKVTGWQTGANNIGDLTVVSDPGTNDTIVVGSDGLYGISGSVRWAANSTAGSRESRIYATGPFSMEQGDSRRPPDTTGGGHFTGIPFQTERRFAGEKITMEIRQTSGGTLTARCLLYVVKLAD